MHLHLLPLLQHIPKGQVSTYGNMATFLGVPNNARHIGKLLGENKYPDVYPCYKVVGSDGKLVGFSTERGVVEKEERLTRDGIIIKNEKIIDLEKIRWKPVFHSYFLAIPLDEKNREVFEALYNKVFPLFPDKRVVSFQKKESPHITLHYFGDLNVKQLATMVGHLRQWEKKKTQKSFSLGCKGFSFFGEQEQRKIGFFKCTKGRGECISFQKELISLLQLREERLFIPHLTFFRVKDPISFSKIENKIMQAVSGTIFNLEVNTIRLYGAVDKEIQVPLIDFFFP